MDLLVLKQIQAIEFIILGRKSMKENTGNSMLEQVYIS